MTAMKAAERLQAELTRLGIDSDINHGYGCALISVWTNLVIWTDGTRYWWRTAWNPQCARYTYACHPGHEPNRAARRIARRYTQVREQHPPAPKMTGHPL
jgi:hypothetical protein